VNAAVLLAGEIRWWHLAACEGADTETFFSEDPARIAEAKAFCARCPVRADCLGDAARAGDVHAVRGGLTWPERRGAPVVTSAVRMCAKELHVMDEENTRSDGRCLACRRAAWRKRNPPSGRGKGNSAVPRRRDGRGRFAGAPGTLRPSRPGKELAA